MPPPNIHIRICGKTYKNRTIYQMCIATFFILILAVTIPTLAIMNNRIGLEKQTNYKWNQQSENGIDPGNVPVNWNGVVIWANVTTIQSQSYSLGVRYSLAPMGTYSSYLGDGITVFQGPVALRSGSQVVKYDSQDFLRASDFVYPILEGDPNLYPFDHYLTSFILSLSDLTIPASATNFSAATIPISIGIVGNVQSWILDIDVVQLEGNNVQVLVYSHRSFIIKFFSFFVLIIMWILSLTILTLASTIWFRDRKAEPPIITLCATLLFALPAIRNTQPDSPPIGATVDVGGFFFNMCITGFSLFIMMINYIYHNPRVKPVVSPATVISPPSLEEKDGGANQNSTFGDLTPLLVK